MAADKTDFDYQIFDDLRLLNAVLEQQERAWCELLRRYRGVIFRCIHKAVAKYRTALTNEDVEEIFAEVCFNLLRNDMRKLRLYDPEKGARLGSWLGLIAINTAYDHLRAVGRQPLLDRVEGCPELADSAADPLDDLLFKERIDQLNQFAARFSTRDQRFLELYYGRGLTALEVAENMRISVKTVYSKKNKISKRLTAMAIEHRSLLAA
ncbi:MAG: sigma-70 family RNA polymerase sigma factor [Deltaproteobacteria bacterium]|nr:sigma-70 family RNA polymerase sigma factor [Deltaproteobacteria bacterium]